jgi:hypothetical protein
MANKHYLPDKYSPNQPKRRLLPQCFWRRFLDGSPGGIDSVAHILSYVPYKVRSMTMIALSSRDSIADMQAQFIYSWTVRGHRDAAYFLFRSNALVPGTSLYPVRSKLLRFSMNGSSPWECSDHRGLVKKALDNCSSDDVLRSVSARLKDDKSIVMAAVRRCGCSLRWAATGLKYDFDLAMTAVKQNGNALRHSYRGENREIVLCAIRRTGGRAFKYAGQNLRWTDRDIVLEAVTRDGSNLCITSWDFRNDYDVVLAAVNQTPWAFEYAGPQARAYKDIVLEAVRGRGRNLKYASIELRNDREVVLEAVRRKGSNLQLASMELRNDPDIVAAAIEVCWRAGYYRGTSLQNDPHIIEKMHIAMAKQGVFPCTTMVRSTSKI